MSSFSSSATQFADWYSLNRSNRLYGADEICDAVQRTNYLIGEMIRANGPKQSVRSGAYIEERVRVTKQGRFQSYNPGQQRSPGRTSTKQPVRFGWRFYENDVTWSDAEIDLSTGDEFTVFKRFKEELEKELEIDHLEGMEDLLFARPSYDSMEPVANQTGAAYSIPAFISENSTTFIPPSSVWGTSTIAGLNPATYSAWRNQQQTYVAGSLDHAQNGILAAFTKMFNKVKFNTPPGVKAYMETDTLRAMKIVTNSDGSAQYQILLRTGQDTFRGGPQDPAYGHPVYMGIPIIIASQLDTELLEEDGAGSSAAYTGSAYPDGKPRFFWLNLKFLKMIFHPKHFMQVVGPKDGGINQRDGFALWKHSWLNLATGYRKRFGVIYPAA